MSLAPGIYVRIFDAFARGWNAYPGFWVFGDEIEGRFIQESHSEILPTYLEYVGYVDIGTGSGEVGGLPHLSAWDHHGDDAPIVPFRAFARRFILPARRHSSRFRHFLSRYEEGHHA